MFLGVLNHLNDMEYDFLHFKIFSFYNFDTVSATLAYAQDNAGQDAEGQPLAPVTGELLIAQIVSMEVILKYKIETCLRAVEGIRLNANIRPLRECKTRKSAVAA